VLIHYLKENPYRRVDFYESIPPFQCIDVGAIAAATTSARTNITNLEQFDEEFGQFRLFTIDNVQMRIYVPSGVSRGQMKNIHVPYVDPNLTNRNPNLNLSEIFVWKDNRPSVEVINFNALGVNTSRLIAFGFRFHSVGLDQNTIDQIKNGKEPVTHIWCSGYNQ
jgi:hypothetical protein